MSWRKLVVDGKSYRWRGGSFVVIQDANGRRIGGNRLTAPEVKGPGNDWNTWERGHWKKTDDGAIRPGEVVAFIRRTVVARSI